MALTGEHADGVVDLVAQEAERRDGDDIVVEPDQVPVRSARRVRALIVGAVVLVVTAAAIGITVAAGHRSNSSRRISTAQSASHHPTPASAAGRHATARLPVTPHKPKGHAKTGSRPVAVVPAPAAPTPVTASAVNPPPAPPAPPVAPPAEPLSVLNWHATPSPLTIKAGGHAALTVDVENPTDGTVTLPLPLSCPPALQKANGAPIGGGVCPEMAQLMSGHQQLTQRYTLYATDSGDASGAALAPGSYVVKIEGRYPVKVNVISS